ncbi:hypothetical protein ESCOCK398M_06770 [Escherichia coli]
MEVNKKQLAEIFGASIRTIQNWQEQGMPVLRGGGKGNEVLYDSAAVIKWYAENGWQRYKKTDGEWSLRPLPCLT